MHQPGRRLLALALVACCLAAVGCGGDDGEGSSDDASPVVVRPGSPEEVAMTIGRVIPNAATKKDCKEVVEINLRSNVNYLCPVTFGESSHLRRFELTDTARFGPRAVLDYRAKGVPDGATMTLFHDVNGEWSISRSGLLPRSEASSDDADRAERDAAFDRYWTAVRERDCHRWVGNVLSTHTDSQLACREEFPLTRPLTELMKSNPDAEPRYVGGTGSFGFYEWAVEEPRPRLFSFGLVETAEGSLRPYVVMDFVEVTREQDAAGQSPQPDAR